LITPFSVFHFHLISFLLLLTEGVPITSGVRYILTGFCNYVEPDFSHQKFMASYDPLYDGSAASGKRGRNADDISTNSRSAFEIGDSDSDSDVETSGSSDGLGTTETDTGIRTGDLLKGIWVYHSDLTSLQQIETLTTLKTYEGSDPNRSREGTQSVDGQQESMLESKSESGVYVLTDGLSTKEIMKVVGFSRGSSRARACSVLVKRDDEADEESPRNEVQRNFPRIAPGLLSTGKYWSYDECLSGEE
jgi:hypothetical protein